jgi:streptogramin lyase
MSGNRALFYVRISLMSLACMGAAPAFGGAPGNAGGATSPDAVWKEAGADEELRQAFERIAYSLEDSGHGTWRGENSAQGLTLEFDGQEARLSHPDGSVSFHLTGYGYGDRLQQPATATLTGTGNRVEYQRGDLTEWYVNGSQGLEHGFTLARRPGTGREGEPLVITLGVGGGLLPARKADDDSVLFASGKGAGLRYAGLKAVDARGHALPSRLEVRGQEIRLMVDDHDAQYPLAVDPNWTQQQELTASDYKPGDQFGASVAVVGDTALIGAPGRNGGQGTAYVFVRSGGTWSMQSAGELTASDGAAGDRFGASVALNGNTAVIGAPGAHGGEGTVYVFVYVPVQLPNGRIWVWAQQQELTAPAGDAAPDAYFGASVAVSGSFMLVGAYGWFGYQGAVYVSERDATGSWGTPAPWTPGDARPGDQFGASVSLSGYTMLFGAADAISGQGAAYTLQTTQAGAETAVALTAGDGKPGDNFGTSVSAGWATAVVGAPGKTVNSHSGQGAAYVFLWSEGGLLGLFWGAEWDEMQELTAADGAAGDGFGSSVSVSGSTAVIGAPGKTINSNNGQGAAYVFVQNDVSWDQWWIQQPALTASAGGANDNFGASVSASGGTVLIGAPGRGSAYAFVGPVLGASTLVVGSSGGSSSVVLACDGAWTATANDPFLHIRGSANGTGGAVVAFSYDAFAGTGTRSGTLTIAGLTVLVTQVGTDYLRASPLTTLVPSSSGLKSPYGVAVDGSGLVYIADTGNGAIEAWAASVPAGAIGPLASGLNRPHGVAVDATGNIYIAETYNAAIDEYSLFSGTQTLVSSGLGAPWGVAVDGFGNVYIADQLNGAISEWNPLTQQLTKLAPAIGPRGVAVDASGNVYIADTLGNMILVWSPAMPQETGLVVPTGLSSPNGVAVDGSGNVYIADTGNNAIKEWSPVTALVTTLASGLNNPDGVAVDGSGNVYIADTGNNAIKEIPYAFVGPASLTEPAATGSDWLQVLPTTTSLAGIFTPSSDQTWLMIGDIFDGAIGFSFTANPSNSTRVAHITVLGQQITVTQLVGQTITFGPLANRTLGTAPFTVSATASSGLPVSFNSQTTSVCAVSGSLVTLVAVGTCTIQATQAGNATYAAATPVNQSFQVTPAGGGSGTSGLVIPHVVDGGGWQTTFGITNTTATTATATLQFYQQTDNAGDTQAWTPPLTGAVSTTNIQLAPGATVFLQTLGTAPTLTQGFGEMIASAGVQGYAIFTWHVGSGYQDGTALAAAPGGTILVPFDNSSGIVTGIAVVNASGSAETLSANLRLASGQVVPGSLPSIPSLGHTSFTLPSLFPQSAGQQGTLELSSSAGTFSVVGLRFHASGAFTSLPVYAMGAAPF